MWELAQRTTCLSPFDYGVARLRSDDKNACGSFVYAAHFVLRSAHDDKKGYSFAMQSISTRAPRGSAATATVERAGLAAPK